MPRQDGYYRSDPSYSEEEHGGGLIRGWNTTFFRFYANGAWLSTSRSEGRNTANTFPFWKFSRELSEVQWKEGQRTGSSVSEDGSVFFSIGSYEITLDGMVKAHEKLTIPLYPSGEEISEWVYVWREEGDTLHKVSDSSVMSFNLRFRRVWFNRF
jgi:hypothetical protein